MDDVSKMKNTNVILISLPVQIHLLQQNYYFKLLFSKNTARKHCNIIFSNSYKTHALFFEFEGNIMNVKRVFGKKS